MRPHDRVTTTRLASWRSSLRWCRASFRSNTYGPAGSTEPQCGQLAARKETAPPQSWHLISSAFFGCMSAMVACPNGLARQDHQFGPQGTETLPFENNGSMPYFRQMMACGFGQACATRLPVPRIGDRDHSLALRFGHTDAL